MISQCYFISIFMHIPPRNSFSFMVMPSLSLFIKLKPKPLADYLRITAHISTILTVFLQKSKWHQKINTMYTLNKDVHEFSFIDCSISSILILYNAGTSHQANCKIGNHQNQYSSELRSSLKNMVMLANGRNAPPKHTLHNLIC